MEPVVCAAKIPGTKSVLKSKIRLNKFMDETPCSLVLTATRPPAIMQTDCRCAGGGQQKGFSQLRVTGACARAIGISWLPPRFRCAHTEKRRRKQTRVMVVETHGDSYVLRKVWEAWECEGGDSGRRRHGCPNKTFVVSGSVRDAAARLARDTGKLQGPSRRSGRQILREGVRARADLGEPRGAPGRSVPLHGR